jgi:hypothetical protein
MDAVREILIMGAAAMVFIIVGKMAAPTIDRIPVIGSPLANLFAVV